MHLDDLRLSESRSSSEGKIDIGKGDRVHLKKRNQNGGPFK